MGALSTSKATLFTSRVMVQTSSVSFILFPNRLMDILLPFATPNAFLKDSFSLYGRISRRRTRIGHWTDIESESSVVQRGEQDVHFITNLHFHNCICDNAVA